MVNRIHEEVNSNVEKPEYLSFSDVFGSGDHGYVEGLSDKISQVMDAEAAWHQTFDRESGLLRERMSQISNDLHTLSDMYAFDSDEFAAVRFSPTSSDASVALGECIRDAVTADPDKLRVFVDAVKRLNGVYDDLASGSHQRSVDYEIASANANVLSAAYGWADSLDGLSDAKVSISHSDVDSMFSYTEYCRFGMSAAFAQSAHAADVLDDGVRTRTLDEFHQAGLEGFPMADLRSEFAKVEGVANGELPVSALEGDGVAMLFRGAVGNAALRSGDMDAHFQMIDELRAAMSASHSEFSNMIMNALMDAMKVENYNDSLDKSMVNEIEKSGDAFDKLLIKTGIEDDAEPDGPSDDISY